MGCWNGTCALTHIPLTAGTKVRGYILVPNKYRDPRNSAGIGLTYPTDLYNPLSWSFKGEYNDYGSMEKIKNDENAKAIVTYFNSLLNKTNLKAGVIQKFKKLEQVLDYINESGGYGFMMIAESVFTHVVTGFESTVISDYESYRSMVNVMEDLRLARDQVKQADADKALKGALSKLKVKSAKQDDVFRFMGSFNMTFPQRDGTRSNIADSFLGRGSDCLIDSDFSGTFFRKLLKNDKVPLQDIADHFIFCCIMSDTRRTWIPQAGAGSQTDQWRMHRIVAESVLAHIEGVKKEHADDVDLTDPAEKEHFDKFY